jgi:hypothetical protein
VTFLIGAKAPPCPCPETLVSFWRVQQQHSCLTDPSLWVRVCAGTGTSFTDDVEAAAVAALMSHFGDAAIPVAQFKPYNPAPAGGVLPAPEPDVFDLDIGVLPEEPAELEGDGGVDPETGPSAAPLESDTTDTASVTGSTASFFSPDDGMPDDPFAWSPSHQEADSMSWDDFMESLNDGFESA